MTHGQDFWNRTASRYDLTMMLLGGPLEPMIERVVDEVTGCDRVLEIAAGTGLVTERIAPVVGSLRATDYAPAMVEQLRKRVDVEAEVLDVMQLPPGDWDAIVATNVLHLLPDAPAARDRMLAALRPGGRLIVPTYVHAQHRRSQLLSHAMGLFGFPGRRRFDLRGLSDLLEHPELTDGRFELLPGLLPIGYASATRRTDGPQAS